VKRDVAARRYAEAAYLIARQDGKVEAWSAGLANVGALFGDERASGFFENKRVPAGQKAEAMERALAGADPLVLNLARLLLRRNRTALGPQIAVTFQELVDGAQGISHAVVTTAVALSREDLRVVEERLREIAGGEVVVETQVDEEILGGLVVRIGDRLIDGSTRSRLLALKRKLAGAAP